MTWMGLTHTEEAVGSLGMETGLGEFGTIGTGAGGVVVWDDHVGLEESSILCRTGWQSGTYRGSKEHRRTFTRAWGRGSRAVGGRAGRSCLAPAWAGSPMLSGCTMSD